MPARRRPARAPFTRGVRAPTNWARAVSGSPQVVASAGQKVLVASVTLSNPGIGETVRRTRGRFFVTSDQSAAQESQLGAFGMIVVTDVAAAIGITAIPGPVTEANDDGWFVWFPIMQRSSDQTQSRSGWEYEFDSKAMRRVEEGSQIAVMYESASASAGAEIVTGFSLLTSLS